MDIPVPQIAAVGRDYAARACEMGATPDRDPPYYFCKPAPVS